MILDLFFLSLFHMNSVLLSDFIFSGKKSALESILGFVRPLLTSKLDIEFSFF